MKKNNSSKSVFASLNFKMTDAKDVKERKASRFQKVAGSTTTFDAKDAKQIFECVICKVTSKLSGRTQLKLVIKAKVGKKIAEKWVKLDGVSAKRYKELIGWSIDPTKVAIYDVYDPEEEYGSEENGYTWEECRIKEGAQTTPPQSNDDDIFNDKVPF